MSLQLVPEFGALRLSGQLLTSGVRLSGCMRQLTVEAKDHLFMLREQKSMR